MKIVIPSHKRADRVSTTKVVDNCSICVPESQFDAYKKHNPNTEIIAHPDSIIGLPPKLQWIYKNFKNVFLLDDDVKEFRRVYETEKSNIKIKPDEAFEIIEMTEFLAKQAGCYLYGFSKDPNPLLYNAHKPIELSGFVVGGSTGLIESELNFDCSMKIKGDVFISCLNAFLYKKCWIDRRFAFTFEKTFLNAGGLTEIRNTELEKNTYLYLKKLFGNVIEKKKNTARRQTRHEFEITIKLPF